MACLVSVTSGSLSSTPVRARSVSRLSWWSQTHASPRAHATAPRTTHAASPMRVRLGGSVGDVDRHSLHYVVLTAQGLGDLPDNNRQICYLLIILIGPHGQYQADNCLE